MHDIRFIRENPEAFDKGLARRGLSTVSPEILAFDAERRATQTSLQELQAKRNDVSRKIGEVKRTGGDADALMQEVASIKDKMTALEESERELGERLKALLDVLPNIPAADVPDGKDEHGNVEVRRFREPPRINSAQEHFDLGEKLGLMDFNTAAKLSGARFTILSGALARLERALGNFMLDMLTQEYGYKEVSPPLMVRDEAEYGVGQLPKFKEDLFQTTTGLWLIPTAEVPLTNVVNGDIIEKEKLPLRMTARTPCFRSEAGSAGRDTRGMLRQHQFYKVEMVSITAPEESNAEHERMTDCAETVLKRLELPFRTIVLCAGDMGFASRKTYDLEVWLPGQNMYREISSCSNCGDFQARRMNARCRAAGEKATEFVHTLNGSGVAVGRCLIAIMENYQQPDGSIAIPAVLQPYMNGLTKIEAA
ncbi:MAG: serine--tRNA ligase [Alphaproteobacteria bacterium]|nr:serine--tRNA ligase [Alphaproteobacteria bacterium]